MNIVFLVGFQILVAAGPLLCCMRTRKKLSVKKIVPLSLTPLEKHKNEYRQSLQKWGQPMPSLTYRVPSLNCTLCGRRVIDETVHSIIHGQPVPDKFYPWQVYVVGMKGLCGGALIAPQWILTAAHCISRTLFTLMGTSNLDTSASQAVFTLVDKDIIHEKYSSASKGYDIALIKLGEAVTYTSYIRPICLPMDIITFNESHECYVTGWGVTDPGRNTTAKQLQQIKVQIMSHTQCVARWTGARVRVTQAQLCTKLNQVVPGSGTCSGDSGGPLSCRVGNRFYLAGIVSMGLKKCDKTFVPDLFTKVSYYREWIMRTILANGDT